MKKNDEAKKQKKQKCSAEKKTNKDPQTPHACLVRYIGTVGRDCCIGVFVFSCVNDGRSKALWSSGVVKWTLGQLSRVSQAHTKKLVASRGEWAGLELGHLSDLGFVESRDSLASCFGFGTSLFDDRTERMFVRLVFD